MPGGFTIGTSLNLGFPGTVSRGGMLDIFARPVKSTDQYPINFGDAVFLNPDSAGGTLSSTQSLVAATTTGSTTNASASVTVASATGIVAGQWVIGAGIPVNASVLSVSGTTVTLSANATATASGVGLTFLTNNGASVGTTFLTQLFSGIAVREVKTNMTYPPVNNVFADYIQGQTCDVLRYGTISVACNVGTPIAGGLVYVRLALNPSVPAGVIGGFEAASDGVYSQSLTAYWETGLLDSNNVAELSFKYRNRN